MNRCAWMFLVLAAAATGAYGQAASRRIFRIEELRTPPGFEVSVWARPGGEPRLMAVAPNGVLYAALYGGQIVALPERDRVVIVARGLSRPHSLAFRDGSLYVAVADGVVRFDDAVTSDLVIRTSPVRVLTSPAGGQHSSRTIGFGPDGALYFASGSTCNFCNEQDPRRAAISKYSLTGDNASLFARGLRNTVGFAWHPVTGEMWGPDHGGDGLGDNEPPEEVNILREGMDYGWPDCVGNRRGVNWGPQARPGRCGETTAPELEYQAHSAPLGFSFYTGDEFPASWKNDGLLGLHGSWNRSQPTGYRVVRVKASTGKAEGMEDLLWGFLDPATRTQSGRPVHAITGADGAVYVSDDETGFVYQVRYIGPRINPGGAVRIGEIEGLGSIYELYGKRLADNPAAFEVRVDGVVAQTLYVSEGQVNFAIPAGRTGELTIGVKNEKGTDEIKVRVD